MNVIRRVWRWCSLWLSGAWVLAQLRLSPAETTHRWVRERPTLHPLLMGLQAAYDFGPNPHQEPSFRAALDPTRRTLCKRGIPRRLVGKPVIYTFKNKLKIGLTEWSNDYVPRAEQLRARKALKQTLRMAA